MTSTDNVLSSEALGFDPEALTRPTQGDEEDLQPARCAGTGSALHALSKCRGGVASRRGW